MTDNLDITASLGAGKTQSSFRSLGSIHCQNGVLEQGSYRASDCHFINQANVLKQDQIAMGLRYGNEHFNTSISMFQRESSLRQQNAGNVVNPLGNITMGADLLTPTQSNPLMSNFNVGQSPEYLQAESTGLDMEFQVGLTMDKAGEVRLGLQLTRIVDLGGPAEIGAVAGDLLQHLLNRLELSEYGVRETVIAPATFPVAEAAPMSQHPATSR